MKWAWLRLAVFYGALAAVIAFAPKAHAEPTQTEACLAFAEQYVPAIHALYQGGMEPGVLRYVVRTSGDLTDQGRWLLVRTVDGLELAAAFGKPMRGADALGLAAYLCALPTIPGVSAIGRDWYTAAPKDI